MDKEKLASELEKVRAALTADVVVSSELLDGLSAVRQSVLGFRAKVLVVGAFSAGKSALLNSLLEEDVLIEDITPETAIATELYYGDIARAVLLLKDGTERSYSLDEARALPATEIKAARKLMYYLPNEHLRDIKGLTLVDMPGFSSGLEEHNRAIMEYIGEAAGYIFVVSADEGTIGDESVTFLREITNYSPIIRFVLTKCDKYTPDTVADIVAEVQSRVEPVLGTEVAIPATSSRLPTASADMMSVLGGLDTDALLMHRLGPAARSALLRLEQYLEDQLAALEFDPHELDREIERNEHAKKMLRSELEARRRSEHNRLTSQGTTQVLAEVRAALEASSYRLTNIVMNNPGALAAEVSSIVRPVLVRSVGDIAQQSYEDIYQSVVSRLESSDVIDIEGIKDKLASSLDQVKAIADGSIELGGKLGKKLPQLGKIFQGLATVLAVVTNVVAPVLELLVIFLPNIMGLFGPSREERTERQVKGEVIPRICDELHGEIAKAMTELEESIIAALEQEFDARLDAANAAIEAAREEKATKEQDVQARRDLLTAKITIVQTADATIAAALEEER